MWHMGCIFAQPRDPAARFPDYPSSHSVVFLFIIRAGFKLGRLTRNGVELFRETQ